MKEIKVREVKHKKDIIKSYKKWYEHDSAFGAGHEEIKHYLYHIYESDDEVFAVDGEGEAFIIDEEEQAKIDPYKDICTG